MQAVARRFAVSVSVVARAWRRYQETDQYTRRCGGGRRRNQLHEDGMRARRPQIGVVLTVQHRAGRLSFARELQDWQIHHWCPVLFTDESRFTQSTCDRRHRVWRRRGERSAACNILQHERFGSGSVMLWGGICLEGRTALHVLARGILTAIGYRDEILRPLVRPNAGAVGPGFLLTQDNARPHVAGVCQQFLQDEGIEAMDWPARSPDLNPIEHIWDIMSRCIHQRHIAPQTVQELADALVQSLRDSSIFYQSVVASVLFYAVVCWGGSISKRDAGRLDRLVRKAGSVLGLELESLTPLAERRALSKLLHIMDNVHHPLHSTIIRQRSSFSGRLLSQSCSTDRLRKQQSTMVTVLHDNVKNCSGVVPGYHGVTHNGSRSSSVKSPTVVLVETTSEAMCEGTVDIRQGSREE
ncbi:hypothetical protein NFI96_003394 [Prochilodus magdalenae]|nr:hypothetical protein NFI96_003394 [Prochilodus magdalenae]